MTIVKICGLTNYEDARFALQSGADMLGFIFYEPSPRYVSPEQVREIVLALRTTDYALRFVGVFVNHPLEVVRQTLDFCGLDFAQLHGDEPPDYLTQMDGHAYKAINPRTLAEAESLIQSFVIRHSSFVLLDAYHPTLRGGTGHIADWTTAAKIGRKYRLLLAGSLTPDNVAKAIRRAKPWGVDVSSGVEAKKGEKDPAKVKAFIKAAKAASKNVEGRQ